MTAKLEGLGFDGWLKKLNEDLGIGAEPSLSEDRRPADDMGKMRRLLAIDRRQLAALPNTIVGRANAAVVRDLEVIAADYEALLEAGPPTIPLYTVQALRTKIADTLSMAARASHAAREAGEAQRLNRAAAKAYRAAGEESKAKECEADARRKKVDTAGDVDNQIRLLREELEGLPSDGLAAAEKLIDLGLLYSKRGDDFDALPLLQQAEKVLMKNGGAPSGADLADALTASLLSIMGSSEDDHTSSALDDLVRSMTPGAPATGSTPIEEKMHARNLFEALYRAYARIYAAIDPAKAAEYRNKADAFDSREENEMFSNAMRHELKGKLGRI